MSKKLILKSKVLKTQINEYKEVFKILDREGTGIISTNDIIKMKEIFSYPISRNGILKMIKEIDSKGDGKFDFKKFVTFIQKQQDYIKEKDGKDVLETFEEDFLGNKRKRELIGNDECYILNYQNNNNYIKNEEDDNIMIQNINENKKKRKLECKDSKKVINDDDSIDDMNNRRTSEQTNKNENCDLSNSNKISKYGNKSKKKNKKMKKNGRKKKNEENSNNIILISKSKLPKEVINQIELKNNNDLFPIKIKNISLNFPYRNTFPSKQPVSLISSRLISEFDFLNSINNINSRDISFISDLSLDLSIKQVEKTPPNTSNKKTNNLLANLLSEQINSKKEKDPNNGHNNNEISFKNKNSSKRIFQNNNNSKLLTPFKKLTNQNKFCLNDNNIIIVYKKQNIKENNNITYSLNKSETKEENIINKEKNSENFPKITPKALNQKIQVLNNFILEYKKKRREKIVQKSIENPYSIIIEKNILNLDESNKVKGEKNIETKKEILCQKTPKLPDNKRFPLYEENNPIKMEKSKKRKSYKSTKNNKDKSIILKKVDYKMKNLRKKEMKKSKIIENGDDILEKKEDKKVNMIIEENEKFLNIANIKFNSYNENNSKIRTKVIKNSILQEKTVIKDETYYKETQICGKNRNENNNINNNETEEKLATIDLLKGFNYLFYQKCN